MNLVTLNLCQFFLLYIVFFFPVSNSYLMNASGDYSICGPQVPVRPLTAICLDRLLCLAFALQHSHQLQHQKPLMETLFETPESLLLVMLVIAGDPHQNNSVISERK